MKKLLPIFTIVAATVVASSAIASPTRDGEVNILAVQDIQDSYLTDARAARQVIKSVRGVYDMNDGTTLSLYQMGRALMVEMSGQAAVEVVATKRGTFRAVDGATEFKFIHDASGQVAKVVLKKSS